MNIVQIASLAGIVLCVIFLILVLIGSIAERIRARRADEEYKEGWGAWGDVTDLRSVS